MQFRWYFNTPCSNARIAAWNGVETSFGPHFVAKNAKRLSFTYLLDLVYLMLLSYLPLFLSQIREKSLISDHYAVLHQPANAQTCWPQGNQLREGHWMTKKNIETCLNIHTYHIIPTSTTTTRPHYTIHTIPYCTVWYRTMSYIQYIPHIPYMPYMPYMTYMTYITYHTIPYHTLP